MHILLQAEQFRYNRRIVEDVPELRGAALDRVAFRDSTDPAARAFHLPFVMGATWQAAWCRLVR